MLCALARKKSRYPELSEPCRWRPGHQPTLDIPVVVLTAKDITADERRRLDAQADRLLQKGQLSVPDLVATLRLLMLPPTLVEPSSLQR
jgi:CheY-like chemotaxis protein